MTWQKNHPTPYIQAESGIFELKSKTNINSYKNCAI